MPRKRQKIAHDESSFPSLAIQDEGDNRLLPENKFLEGENVHQTPPKSSLKGSQHLGRERPFSIKSDERPGAVKTPRGERRNLALNGRRNLPFPTFEGLTNLDNLQRLSQQSDASTNSSLQSKTKHISFQRLSETKNDGSSAQKSVASEFLGDHTQMQLVLSRIHDEFDISNNHQFDYRLSSTRTLITVTNVMFQNELDNMPGRNSSLRADPSHIFRNSTQRAPLLHHLEQNPAW